MSCDAGVIELGAEQRKVLSRKKGPVLLLSGAGTGKTTVLAYRYAHLVKASRREPVLMLCKDAASVRRMRRLVEQVGGSAGPDAWIHTFHQFSLRLLREDLLPDVPFCVYDDEDREQVIRGILKEFKMHEALFKGITARISGLKARGITPEEFIAGKDGYGFDEKLARIYGRYQEELRRNRALDFEDLISQAVALVEAEPKRVQNTLGAFRHVLVDDFQDLTPAQYSLVRAVAGARAVLFVAGDGDQSIFGYRGADGEILDRFRKDYPKTAVVRFSRNYRCTDSVLDAAEAVIGENSGRGKKSMKATREGEDLPVYSCTGDEVEEAKHIAYLLKDLYLKDRYRYGEMCVLYRVPLQGKVITDVLRAEGVPVNAPDGKSGIFQSPEVKDVLCYLRVLLNPHDSLSLERIINRPHRGIGEAALNRLRLESRKRDLSLLETIEKMSKGSKTLAKVMPLLKVFRKEAKNIADGGDLVPVLRRLLENSGYADWLLEQDGGEGEAAARRLSELLAMAEGRTIREVLDRLALRTGMSDSAGNSEAVQVLTIHQASGMEFAVVFLAGLEEGMLPYVPSRRLAGDVEEERRLAYVAMTRARDRLFLSGARRRKTFTGLQTQKPSRFLDCLPDTLCRRFERSTRTEVSKEPIRRKRSRSGDGTFPVGARVRHTTWGVGVVRDCNGQGEAARVTVNFPSVGIKRLSVKFANLERI